MSLRSAPLLLALILGLGAGCGGGGGRTSGGGRASANEPQTAKEKQLQEAKASGEIDGTAQTGWGKWRYTGDRNNCFYVAANKCFKTEVAACQTMKCKAGQKCKSAGAGPATVSCGR